MARKYSKGAAKKVERAMHKRKRGTLKSGAAAKREKPQAGDRDRLSEAAAKARKSEEDIVRRSWRCNPPLLPVASRNKLRSCAGALQCCVRPSSLRSSASRRPYPRDAAHRIAGRPATLDPAQSVSFTDRVVMAAVCDKLVELDPKLNYVPQLATEWRGLPTACH